MLRDENPNGNDGLVLENYTVDDIDLDTLHRYRNRFRVVQPENVWNEYSDLDFLKKLYQN